MLLKTIILAICVAGPAAAQTLGKPVLVIAPAVGKEATATAGAEMFVRQNSLEFPGVTILGTSAPNRDSDFSVTKGEIYGLAVETKKKLTACFNPQDSSSWCLTDRDLDGRFDVVNTQIGVFPIKLQEPLAYERGAFAHVTNPNGTFKQTLTFLGVSGATLRINYREFNDDMARPAFTDEATFTLSGTYPETIAYKDIVIDVLGIGNAGIRYVVRKANATAQ